MFGRARWLNVSWRANAGTACVGNLCGWEFIGHHFSRTSTESRAKSIVSSAIPNLRFEATKGDKHPRLDRVQSLLSMTKESTGASATPCIKDGQGRRANHFPGGSKSVRIPNGASEQRSITMKNAVFSVTLTVAVTL